MYLRAGGIFFPQILFSIVKTKHLIFLRTSQTVLPPPPLFATFLFFFLFYQNKLKTFMVLFVLYSYCIFHLNVSSIIHNIFILIPLI